MRCPSCYKPVADNDNSCPHCGVSLSMWKPPAGNPSAAGLGGDFAYVGFWMRVVARLIDGFVVGFGVIVLLLLVALAGGGDFAALASPDPEQTSAGMVLLILLIYLIIPWLYFALQESSPAQATLGKRAIGARVTDLNGDRISFAHATGRYFATALCYITLYIGFLMAAFTARKQALHDMATNTVVSYADGKPAKTGCLMIGVLAVVMVMVLGILAAVAIPAYQDYVKKAKAQAEASQSVDDVAPTGDISGFNERAGMLASAVEERQAADGVLPDSLEAAQVTLDESTDAMIATIGHGGIVSLFARDGSRQLTMIPQVEADGSITWNCAGDGIADEEFPDRCK